MDAPDRDAGAGDHGGRALKTQPRAAQVERRAERARERAEHGVRNEPAQVVGDVAHRATVSAPRSPA